MRTLVVLLAFMATAQAQGVSYIGLCNSTWDCDSIMRTWDSKPIITGWLEESFGARCECGKRILRSEKEKVLRIHLINSPCMRNNRCEPSDVLYKQSAASASRKMLKPRSDLRRKFQRVVERFKRRIAASKGPLTCYVSPCLECDLYGPARKAMLDIVSIALPACILVDNPLKGHCIEGTVCERHGSGPGLSSPCIADLDGEELSKTVDIQRFYRNTRQCDLRFYWSSWMNCSGVKDPSLSIPLSFTPPSERRCNSSMFKIKEAGRIAWKLLSPR